MKTYHLCVAMAFALLSAATCAVPAFGHAGDTPAPPALLGSREVCEELASHCRFLFDAEQLQRLDQLREMMRDERRGKRKTQDEAKLAELAAIRATAEAMLVKLLDTYPNSVDITVEKSGEVTLSRKPTFELIGDSWAVLFRIRNGDGPVTFSNATWDMEETWELQPENAVPYAPTGTTYALLTFTSVPSGDSLVSVGFIEQGTDGPVAPALLTLIAPERGCLDLRLEDEHGKDTPALVRLESCHDDRMHKPSGALRFSEQFDPSSAPPQSSRLFGADTRPLGIPGPFMKRYHVVPGSFAVGLPPGEYEVMIHHGIEYVPMRDTFTVASGKLTKKTFRLERWTDMAARGWYSGDDHVHARIMNDHDANIILTFTKAVDVNVANILRMGDHRRTWFEQRGFGCDFRVREGNCVLVPGQEGPRYYMGHAIGLNLKRMVRDRRRYLDNAWVADTIHADGGLYGQAHLAGKLFNIDRDLAMLVSRGKSDFGEVLQFGNLDTDLWYEYLDLGFKLTASAGSDVPYGGCIGDARIYARTGGQDLDPDAWFDAVKRGEVFVTNGPMIEFEVDGQGPGAEITVDGSRPLRVRAKTWGLAGASAPKSLKIVRLSETIEEVTSEGPEQEALEISLNVDSAYGFWISARVESHDRSAAHTSPVYVRREGFRHWNTARVPDLIQTRYDTLDQVRAELQKDQEALKNGTIDPLDHYRRGLGEQAHLVLDQVAEVRAIFEVLDMTLESELAVRQE